MTGSTKDEKMYNVPMMTEDVILSVHIPKTAGITLYSMYKEAYYELSKFDKAFYDRTVAYRAWRIANPRLWKLALCTTRLKTWLMNHRKHPTGR
jgi:hypothetical protein